MATHFLILLISVGQETLGMGLGVKPLVSIINMILGRSRWRNYFSGRDYYAIEWYDKL